MKELMIIGLSVILTACASTEQNQPAIMSAPQSEMMKPGPVESVGIMNEHLDIVLTDDMGENYAAINRNKAVSTVQQSVSTFSIDVDTASYANARRFIEAGVLPPADAIRTEEFINYFNYAYESPESEGQPFAWQAELGPSPWSSDKKLLHVGLKAWEPKGPPPATNLVFLVDVSGSMSGNKKLGLVKKSLNFLVDQMRPQDSISLVVYAGAAGLVLEPTSGRYQSRIRRAINRLGAGGSTNGAAGIELAYMMAKTAFIPDGINRIMLATDGDFNVGMSSTEELKDYIAEKRKTGIGLSVLGFGTGNYNDYLMEELSNHGDGNAAYIDSLQEAQKVLVDEMSSTLFTVARDVKIQVEFNHKTVKNYRLLGYENRLLNNEDFDNDKKDAGDIGAGHTVTAIYELELYGNKHQELAELKVRYKLPKQQHSHLTSKSVTRVMMREQLEDTSHAFRFSAAVTAFSGWLIGDSSYGDFQPRQIISLANDSKADDRYGYRGEFVQLVRLAETLHQE